MKRLGLFLHVLPLDGMLVFCRSLPHSLLGFSNNLLETGTLRVKCLAQKHNTVSLPWPGLEPGPLDLETSALTRRPLHLHSYFFFILIAFLSSLPWVGDRPVFISIVNANTLNAYEENFTMDITYCKSYLFHGHCLSHNFS